MAAPGSLNIFVWTKALLDQAARARGDVAERAGALGARGREDAQVTSHRQHEEQRRAPETAKTNG